MGAHFVLIPAVGAFLRNMKWATTPSFLAQHTIFWISGNKNYF